MKIAVQVASVKTKLGLENGPGGVKVTVTKNRKTGFWMISHERLHIFKQYLVHSNCCQIKIKFNFDVVKVTVTKDRKTFYAKLLQL